MAKRPRPGQPTKYDPGYCEMLKAHMREGLSFLAFGGVIDVDKDTLYEWAKRHPEFSAAKRLGTARCRLWWEKKGGELNEVIKDPDGTTITRSMPPAVWIYNMKCRFREEWHDQIDVKASVKANVTTTDSAAKEVKELVDLIRKVTDEEKSEQT